MQETNRYALVEICLKHGSNSDKAILDVYVIKGSLNVGDIVECTNDTAEVCKYDEHSDYYSLSCNADGAFAKALGNIVTVVIR